MHFISVWFAYTGWYKQLCMYLVVYVNSSSKENIFIRLVAWIELICSPLHLNR
jgi:hypothetical protein